MQKLEFYLIGYLISGGKELMPIVFLAHTTALTDIINYQQISVLGLAYALLYFLYQLNKINEIT